MKVGIIGAGFVGAACAKAMLLRGSCQEIVLLDTKVYAFEDKESGIVRNIRRDEGVATDLSHGELLCPSTSIRHGNYTDFSDAAVVVITAGINEKTGRAIDRGDSAGRLRLLPENEDYNPIEVDLEQQDFAIEGLSVGVLRQGT